MKLARHLREKVLQKRQLQNQTALSILLNVKLRLKMKFTLENPKANQITTLAVLDAFVWIVFLDH